jgi:hypothetical protein
MRKIKSIKGITNIKKGYAKLGDLVLAVRTRGYKDDTVFKAFKEQAKQFPAKYKERWASIEEKEKFEKEKGIELEDNMPLVIIEYDTTSKAHEESAIDDLNLAYALGIVNYMDFESTNENGSNYWEDLGIPVGDYIAVAKHIADFIQPSQEDLTVFFNEIEKIKNKQKTLADYMLEVEELEEKIEEEATEDAPKPVAKRRAKS